MRTGASDVPFRGHRGRIRPDARLNKTRKARLRRAFLENESLEARTLLATIPTPAVIGRVDISNPSGITDDHSNESTPSIAVDPMDSRHLASAWTEFDTDPDPDFIGVGLRMSNNGGATWATLSVPDRRIDPSTSNPAVPYSRITDASVAFARDGSFYLLTVQHNDGNTAGEVVLARYSSSGSLANETTVYAWNRSATNQGGAKAVQLPILAVDNTAPSFPTSSGTQTNSHVGNVYVAWIGQTPAPSGATNWNELTVELTTSTDRWRHVRQRPRPEQRG